MNLVNHPAGVVLIDSDLIADNGASWKNNGEFEIFERRTLSVGGGFDQVGGSLKIDDDAELKSGAFNHSGGTTMLGFDPTPNTSTRGSIEVAGGDGGLALTGGTLAGSGGVDVGTADSALTNSGGTLAPGQRSAPVLAVHGDYVQGAGGTLAIEITGPPQSGNTLPYDRLIVNGNATLGGTLELTTPFFTPTFGQEWVVLWDYARTGVFDSVTGEPGLTVSYPAIGVAVHFSPPPINPPPPAIPDTAPPETTIVQRPRKNGKKRKVTFAFTSYEVGSTFTCKLDDKPSAPCTSPFSAKVKRAEHTFSVTATDTAGNADPSPATVEFKVKKRKRK